MQNLMMRSIEARNASRTMRFILHPLPEPHRCFIPHPEPSRSDESKDVLRDAPNGAPQDEENKERCSSG